MAKRIAKRKGNAKGKAKTHLRIAKRRTGFIVKKNKKKIAKHHAKKTVKKNIHNKKTITKISHAAKSSNKTKTPTSKLARILTQERDALRPMKLSEPAVEKFLAELRQKLPQAQIVPGGSYAKGTFIRGNHDVDVFIRFPHGTTDENMSAAIAKAIPKATRVHGSRDYFQVTRGDFMFELVPVLAITHIDEALNVTDHSPLHVEYISALLTPALKDDARLAKQFCKGAGVYGAESHIRGFSGYVLEVLTAHYNGFENLLQAALTWRRPVVIDPAKHFSDGHSAILRLNEAKIISPIILIDPVHHERNASAALSDECMRRFQEHARAFLTAPSTKFFDPRITRAEIIRACKNKFGKKSSILFATAKTPRGKSDVVGCQVLAKHELTRGTLDEHEFGLMHAEWRFGAKESLCWYVVTRTTLPKMDEQRGPPVDMKSAVLAFTMKHSKAFIRDGRYYAPITREYTSAKAVLKDAWKGLPVKFS